MPVHFFNESSDFYLADPMAAESWLEKVCQEENQNLGELSVVFCDDEYLLKINQDYLQHDFYTDIITFDYSDKDSISGDLFLSIERIAENAKNHDTNFQHELHRVMVHGLLHLLGYQDKEEEDQLIMRNKEDHYLLLRPE